jgi:hypothetical protein
MMLLPRIDHDLHTPTQKLNSRCHGIGKLFTMQVETGDYRVEAERADLHFSTF